VFVHGQIEKTPKKLNNAFVFYVTSIPGNGIYTTAKLATAPFPLNLTSHFSHMLSKTLANLT
jgi:hypothetical protein